LTPKGKKQEPKFGLNMDFGDALSRFVRTDPEEVEANIARSKKKKPKGPKKKKKTAGGKKAPPATLDGSVISLRARRMRKRNYGR
jgi:hypothetical protein